MGTRSGPRVHFDGELLEGLPRSRSPMGDVLDKVVGRSRLHRFQRGDCVGLVLLLLVPTLLRPTTGQIQLTFLMASCFIIPPTVLPANISSRSLDSVLSVSPAL